MFCPKCKAEYRPGFTRCPDCQVNLVDKRSPETEAKKEYVEWITVMETGNSALIAVAKSILAAEHIQYYAKGEELQDLFALGRLGTKYNPVVGPIQIQVDKPHVEQAKKLLEGLEESEPDPWDTPSE